MSQKIYRVTLTEDEEKQLRDIINKGKHGAQKRRRAQALLLANGGYTDETIAERTGLCLRGAGGGNAGAFDSAYQEVGFDTVHTLPETWEGGTFFRAENPEMGESPYRETGVFAVRGSMRIAETIARFSFDAMPAAMTAIERAYTRGEISEEMYIVRKDHIEKQNDFLGAMKETGKFIAGNAKVTIFVMAAGVLGGILSGTGLYGQTVQETAEVSIAFGISGIVIFLLPLLLLSIVAGIVSSRVAAGFSVGASININGLVQ
jgi:hypothetical protein